MLCPAAQDEKYKEYKDFQGKPANQNVDFNTGDKVVNQKTATNDKGKK